MNRHPRYKRRIFPLLLLVCLLFTQPGGCGSADRSVSKSGFYFDTIITITLYGTDDGSLIDECFSLASDYEQKLSATVEDSEISAINKSAGSPVTVSGDTLELIEAGISYGDLSGGKFAITIGALSSLWNIPELAKNSDGGDNGADASVLPDAGAVADALSHVDDQCIEIKGSQVRLTDPDASIDLGGIAKGYIADRMRESLRDKGVTSGIINLGGNVLTLGEKADDEPYRIGIQKPFADTGTSLGTLTVQDASVVSSGVYERYITVDGKRYHHILDTDTGYPVENNLDQVTIISECSMDGDALSTVCLALGLDDGMALVESLDGIEAIFVTDDGGLHFSSGFGDGLTFSPLSPT